MSDRTLVMFSRRLRQYLDAWTPLFDDAPSPSSQMAREIADHPALPMLEVWTTPNLLIGAAVDHLSLIVAGLDAPQVTVSLLTTARNALELAATAHWLLDPTQTVTERAARHFVHELNDRVRTWDLVNESIRTNDGVFTTDNLAAVTTARDAARARAYTAGLSVDKMTANSVVSGVRAPVPRVKVGLSLGEDAHLAGLLYERDSAILHGRFTSILQHTTTVDAPGPLQPGMVLQRMTVDSTDLALAITVPTVVLTTVLSALARARGWHVDPRVEETSRQLKNTVRPHLYRPTAQEAGDEQA